MSKELTIRNGFLIYSNSVYSPIITGITNNENLQDVDYRLVTESAIKTYVDNAVAAAGGAQGPLGTIQYSDGSGDFTGDTSFSWDSGTDTLTVDGTISGETLYLSDGTSVN